MGVIHSVLLCRGRLRDWLTAARTSSRRRLPSCQGLAAARAWNVVAAARPSSPLPPARVQALDSPRLQLISCRQSLAADCLASR
jgi:hypothetical protein